MLSEEQVREWKARLERSRNTAALQSEAYGSDSERGMAATLILTHIEGALKAIRIILEEEQEDD